MGSQAKHLEPFPHPPPQPDGPHASASEAQLAMQTSGAYYLGAGTCSAHNYLCPFDRSAYKAAAIVGAAPYCYLQAVQTWDHFVQPVGYPVTDFEVPWYHAPGFDKIVAVMTIITNVDVKIALRLVSGDLVDAVAETTGEPSLPTHARGAVTGSLWARGETFGRYRSLTKTIELYAPTLPANRRIVIRPEAQVSTDYAHILSAGAEVLLYIKSMLLFDAVDEVNKI